MTDIIFETIDSLRRIREKVTSIDNNLTTLIGSLEEILSKKEEENTSQSDTSSNEEKTPAVSTPFTVHLSTVVLSEHAAVLAPAPTPVPAPVLSPENRDWLKKRGCQFEKNGKPVLITREILTGHYNTFTLAPEKAVEYITKEIKERRFINKDRYSWQSEGKEYQSGYHDPSSGHIQKLFQLFNTKEDRTLTLEEIIEEFGDFRHCSSFKTSRGNDKYWKDALRELDKQYFVERKP